MKFLSYAKPETYLSNTIKNQKLAQYTLRVLEELCKREALSFSQSNRGALIIHRNQQSFDGYAGLCEKVCKDGIRFEVLDRDGLIEKEPTLSAIKDQLAGCVYFPDDGSGNARTFCSQLSEITRRDGTEFSFDTRVRSVSVSTSGVTITSDSGVFDADAVIIAAGSHSRRMARTAGVSLPMIPAKGYSISIPMEDWPDRPRHVIADMGVHAGVNPLGDALRVAGTAEFTGHKQGISPERVDYLIGLARQIFPNLVQQTDASQIDPWGGHRPLSVDGLPMIGATSVPNVYVNTGHGGLGWTQSAGSSKALADEIAGKVPEIDLSHYSLARFA